MAAMTFTDEQKAEQFEKIKAAIGADPEMTRAEFERVCGPVENFRFARLPIPGGNGAEIVPLNPDFR